MMYKFKKFLEERRDGVLLCFALLVVAGVMLSSLLISHNAEDTTPMESTSEEGIKARSFDYKGHQYILFEENRRFGASSILHNPDCRKCKHTQ